MVETVLKAVADIQVGYQAKTRIKERIQGTHRLIQSKDFDFFHRLQSENLTGFFPERKPETYSVIKGDILFQARGIVHFATCIEVNLKNVLAAGSFYIIRLKNGRLHPQYLAWCLSQKRAQVYFQSKRSGTGISFVSKGALSQLEIQIPPLSLQQKIMKVVKLQEHERFLLEKLSERRSYLIQAVCLKAIRNDPAHPSFPP